MNECIVCGSPCPDHLRYCSNSCAITEDGEPWHWSRDEDTEEVAEVVGHPDEEE